MVQEGIVKDREEKHEASANDETVTERKTPRIVRVLEKGMWDLERDPEFEALLTPLKKDEFSRLKAGIEHDGCTDSVITWNKVIIDGHNRYNICWEVGIPFAVTEMEFSGREEAILWMINRQLGRRNVPAYKRTVLALMQESIIAQQAEKRMLLGKKIVDPPQNSAGGVEKGETRDKIARIAGVSHDTVAKVKKLSKEADEETKEKLSKGEMSINKAIKEMRKKKEKIDDPKNDSSTGEALSSEGIKRIEPNDPGIRSTSGATNGADGPTILEVIEESTDSDSTYAEIESTKTDEPIATPLRVEKSSVHSDTEFTYDRVTQYPGITVLDHPIELPTDRRDPHQDPRPFIFVQGQVHFALKNMLKELQIGLDWIMDEDRKRIPELMEMLRGTTAKAEEMMKEMEVTNG